MTFKVRRRTPGESKAYSQGFRAGMVMAIEKIGKVRREVDLMEHHLLSLRDDYNRLAEREDEGKD